MNPEIQELIKEFGLDVVKAILLVAADQISQPMTAVLGYIDLTLSAVDRTAVDRNAEMAKGGAMQVRELLDGYRQL